MADEPHHHRQPQDLPQVLVLGPPTCFSILECLFSHNFHFLNPETSPLPLHQFLIDPSSIRAIVCGANCSVTAEVLRLLPSLGIIVTTSVGTDHIDMTECRRHGIQVAGAGNLYSEDVADVAVGLLIDVVTKISAADRYVRSRIPSVRWRFPLGSKAHMVEKDQQRSSSCQDRNCRPRAIGSKLGGKRVGIVGLGSIGMETAKRLEAFGCIIMYHSRNKKPFVSYPFYSNILELAAASDALMLCCPLNEKTRHMVNKEVMLALGREGVIVNVGRGGLIDEKEMVKCLMEGEIGGAGLDVFENEPHVPEELFALDNVVLSPHAAVFTSESMLGICELMASNLEAFFSNKPLVTPVIVD